MARTVGRYALERKLAVGGMAEVWLARAQGPGGFSKQVVVKRVLEHLAAEPRFVEMFLHEASLVAQLDHPHIVQLFDFGEEEGTHYLAMEYVDGPSVKGLVQAVKAAGAQVPFAVAARLLAQACEGLAHAHDAKDAQTGQPLGLVHRDISPDNLLLSRAGMVKVADFGIAKSVVQKHRTKTGMVKGKLAYMSPEQLKAEPLDRTADVYALGVVLYELLTLARPFNAKGTAELMRAVVSEPVVPVRTRRAEVPAELARVAEKALEKERGRRFTDCRDMQRALEGWLVRSGQSVSGWDVARWMEGLASGVEGTAEFTPEELTGEVALPGADGGTDAPGTTQEGADEAPPGPADAGHPRAWRAGLAMALVLLLAAGAVLVTREDAGVEVPPPARPSAAAPAAPATEGPSPELPPALEKAKAHVRLLGEEASCGGTPGARRLLEQYDGLVRQAEEGRRGKAELEVISGLRMFPARVDAECSAQNEARVERMELEASLAGLVAKVTDAERTAGARPACPRTELAARRSALEQALTSLKVPERDKRVPVEPALREEGAKAEALLVRCRGAQAPGAPGQWDTADAQSQLVRGTEAIKVNDLGQALAAFRQCVGLDPAFAQCWRGLGVVYARTERPSEGAAAYRRFVELAPNDPKAPAVRVMLREYQRSEPKQGPF